MKAEKGPSEVLRALTSGDPEQVAEALAFQRESFRAALGCYPEELIWDDDEDADVPDTEVD